MAMSMLCVLLNAQLHPDYENPEVFERNQEPPHATLMPYSTIEKALEGERKSSSFHMTLNGTWLFNWSENPDVAPHSFFESGYNRGGWKTIPVPSNWQMEGEGYPLFRNIGLSHPMDPPEVPKQFNPTASYYRTFELPADWKDRQVFLHFEGVHSASYVWINGKEVGYNQGGMEPAEYNITPYLRKGNNSIAVRVLRYSDGSYLEDQDTWRLSGIYRDVYLMAAPEAHIRDFYVRTDLDESYEDASLNVALWVKNYNQKKLGPYSLRTRLFDRNGHSVEGGKGTFLTGALKGGAEEKVELSLEISDPDKWSAEYPHLYTLVMELLDGDELLEVISSRIGFREVEVKDQAIYVNGTAIKFNGVNSHMMHPETGHTMDVETMRKDLHLMKQFNINCVRTSHYPPNVEYLDLADELGIYMIDETGDEAHGYIEISHDPLWKDQYLDRMRKMVYRDRNHASVVIWSAGNESGSGENICSLIAEGKTIDPSRPAWMYGGNRDEDPKTNPIKCEDVVGPRYLQPFMLEQRFGKSDDPRPSFMDEYIAATGNSLGGLDEYWELIYRYPRLTGGAIWDWVSPGITQPVISTVDDSPSGIQCVFMNRAKLVGGESGKALYLSGNDDWLEVARDPSLDICGEGITISFNVKPEEFNGNAAFLTKGDYQFGVIQSDEKHLEFYLNTGRRITLSSDLPKGWAKQWHHVMARYDGEKMELYVDGALIGSKACEGQIVNSPYQVILGKSAELRDGHRGYMCHATIDNVRIFDSALSINELTATETLKSTSLLWLDFETSQTEGSYYSIGIPGRTYGLVWPDRSVQPELWQLKKSPQPVAFKMKDLDDGIIELTNRHHFRNLEELDFRWELTADGVVQQAGKFQMELDPGDRKQVNLPYKNPDIQPGTAWHLLVSCSIRDDFPWAKAGHEVAWEQYEFPYQKDLAEHHSVDSMEVVDNESYIKMIGEGFAYTFDKQSGLISSMIIQGKELISRGPLMNVWRAPLANDLDSWNFGKTEMGHVTEGMGKETANGWRSTGLDRLKQDVDMLSSEKDQHGIRIHVEASLHAMNHTTGFKVFYDYTISGDGEMQIACRVSSRGNMCKWIPKVGLQLELTQDFRQMKWLGRGPFENYPDRKTGAKTGIYETTVDEAYVPYIIPQDYGNRCDVHWFRLTDNEGRGLYVSSDELFNVSAQLFTTENLDRAHYPFQLKKEGVVTLNLDHRVSGVGGTANSVLNPYRVAPGEFNFTFLIKALKTVD